MREQGIAGITRHERRNLTKPDEGAAAVAMSGYSTWDAAAGKGFCVP